MTDKLVSVVMTTYNVSKYLHKTILSVLNQMYKNLEMVIIDDGSTDSTTDILKNFMRNENIRVFFREHTGNIGKNLNDCIRFAKGNIIAVLGADDMWMPDKLEVQMEYLKNDEIVCSNGSAIDGNDKIISERILNFDSDSYLDLSLLLRSYCILSSSVLAYRYVLEECSLFDECVGNRSEDYILWLQIAAKYKIKYINQVLVSYRLHGENLSQRSNADKKELFFRNLEILSPYLKHKDKKIVESALIGICNEYVRLIKVFYSERDIVSCHLYSKKLISIYNRKVSIKYLKYLTFYFFISFLKIFHSA